MESQRIGIAGFGIGGAAVSLLLARRGHRVTVLERAPAVGPVGAGLLLQPSGQRVLARAGLLAPVALASASIAGVRAVTHRRRRLIELGNGPGRSLALGVHRGLLFETLHVAARAAGATIELDFEVAGWTDRREGTVLRASDGREAGPFDLVVAVDGARSRLRPKVDPEVAVSADPFAAFWAVGPCTAISDHLFQATRGTRELLGILPLGGGRANLHWGLRAAEVPALRRSSFSAFRDRLLRLAPEAEEIFAEISGFDAFTLGGYVRARPRTLARGRVVLLGDAAHPMPPHLGQGANLALGDAESLAEALGECSDLPGALALHLAHRRRKTAFYVDIARLLAPVFQSHLPLLGALRDLGLPHLSRIPPLRRAMEETLAGERPGWLSGPPPDPTSGAPPDRLESPR